MTAVQRGGTGRLLHAEEEKQARDLLLVFGEILRRHDGLDQDRVVHGVEHGVKLLHQLARVAHAGVTDLAIHVDLRAGGRLESLHERGDLVAEGAVEVVAEHAQRAADRDLLGDNVVRCAALDLAEREQRVLMRVHIARDDGLHHRDELRRNDDGVDAHLRRGSVGALAVDGDLEIARLRHEIVPAHTDLALRHGRPQVQAVDAVDLRVFERAVVDHAPRAGPALFAGLEQQDNITMNVRAIFGDPARKEQKDRHMPVVAAAVHVAGVLRAVGHVIGLVIVDAVHIGAEGDGRLGVLSEKHSLHTADGRRLDAVRAALLQLAQDIGLRIA